MGCLQKSYATPHKNTIDSPIAKFKTTEIIVGRYVKNAGRQHDKYLYARKLSESTKDIIINICHVSHRNLKFLK